MNYVIKSTFQGLITFIYYIIYYIIYYKRGGWGEEKWENLPRTDNQTENKQTDSSNTEATLILCGLSGERANKREPIFTGPLHLHLYLYTYTLYNYTLLHLYTIHLYTLKLIHLYKYSFMNSVIKSTVQGLITFILNAAVILSCGHNWMCIYMWVALKKLTQSSTTSTRWEQQFSVSSLWAPLAQH